jgi:hypothetical protein
MPSITMPFDSKEEVAAFIVSLMDAGIVLKNASFTNDAGKKQDVPFFSIPVPEKREYTRKKNVAAFKHWSDREDDYVVKHFGKKPLKVLADDLSRAEGAVYNRAKHLKKQGRPVSLRAYRKHSSKVIVPVPTNDPSPKNVVFSTTPDVYAE